MTMGFTQINRSSNLSEKVATIIKESILSSRYRPGDALPSETKLGDQFGVSRVVIREALKELKSTGLIEIRRGPKGGPYVCQLNTLNFGEQFSHLVLFRQMTVDQLFQVRLLIEPEALRLVIHQVSDEELDELIKIVEKTEQQTDHIRIKDLNMEFHQQIGRLTGNPFYSFLHDSFMEFSNRFIELINAGIYNMHHEHHHREITDAIVARDEVKALTLMRTHLLDTRDRMRSKEQSYLLNFQS